MGYALICNSTLALVASGLAAVTFILMPFAEEPLHHFSHGDTPFMGQGVVRRANFAVLISHVLLEFRGAAGNTN